MSNGAADGGTGQHMQRTKQSGQRSSQRFTPRPHQLQLHNPAARAHLSPRTTTCVRSARQQEAQGCDRVHGHGHGHGALDLSSIRPAGRGPWRPLPPLMLRQHASGAWRVACEVQRGGACPHVAAAARMVVGAGALGRRGGRTHLVHVDDADWVVVNRSDADCRQFLSSAGEGA